MSKKTFFLIALPLLCISTYAQQEHIVTNVKKDLTDVLDKLVDENKIPGANLSVILNTGEQISISSGFSDIENNIKLSNKNLMFSGSIGKTYAAALIIQLVDEQKINLSDRFINYFSDIEWLKFWDNSKAPLAWKTRKHRNWGGQNQER